MTTRLLDTLARIESRWALDKASPPEKTAAAMRAEPSEASLVRGIASALRSLPPQEVTDDDLYAALKAAEERAPLPPFQVDGGRPSDQLRKIAYALRVADRTAAEACLEKAAHMIRATQALTLLRDRVRAL